MKSIYFGLLLASALLLAQGVEALTLDTRTPINADGSAKFVDPDERAEKLASPPTNGAVPGSKTFRSGNMTFSFGVSRDDERPGFGRGVPFNNFGANRGLRGFGRDW